MTLFILFSSSTVMAATKEDVIAALNATYTVGDDTYRLPQSAINKGVNFLNKKKLTSEQYDKILGLIGSAVSLARQAGTTDITKVSKEDLRKGLGIIAEASSVANVSLSEVTSSLYKNAGKDTSSNTKANPGATTSNEKNSNNNVSNENKAEINLSGEETSFGETHSGEVSSRELQSGELSISGEVLTENNLDVFNNLENESDGEVEKIINRNIIIAIIVVILVLFILFFIIYLLFKSKWNRIAKYILIIIFVILFLVTLFALCVAIAYLEEIRMIYKLYYIFK